MGSWGFPKIGACLEVECLLPGVGDVQRHPQHICAKVHFVAQAAAQSGNARGRGGNQRLLAKTAPFWARRNTRKWATNQAAVAAAAEQAAT